MSFDPRRNDHAVVLGDEDLMAGRPALRRGQTLGPAALARLCAASGTPLIHVSTDQVFDGTLPRAYREDDAVNPISVYGRSKLEGEEQVLSASPERFLMSSRGHVETKPIKGTTPRGADEAEDLLRAA